MHRLLSVAEIVRYIVSFLGSPDALAASMVSKFWMDPALDIVWEDVRSDIFTVFDVEIHTVEGVSCIVTVVCAHIFSERAVTS